jgi:hypothetical protein
MQEKKSAKMYVHVIGGFLKIISGSYRRLSEGDFRIIGGFLKVIHSGQPFWLIFSSAKREIFIDMNIN